MTETYSTHAQFFNPIYNLSQDKLVLSQLTVHSYKVE